MLMVALVFATFYLEYLNFYELANKCTNVRIAVQIDVLKLEEYILASQRKKKKNTGNVRSCFETDVVWPASPAD